MSREAETGPWWTVFRDLRECQDEYGLKPRHMDALAALLSFLKPKTGHMIVFASNRTIMERMNNVSERTLQRCLERLVAAGIVQRHDSPNRKRFPVRLDNRQIAAYGLDLAPLIALASKISERAVERRREAELLHLARHRLRDHLSQIVHQGEQDEIIIEMRKQIRRRLTLEQVTSAISKLETLLPSPIAAPHDGLDAAAAAQLLTANNSQSDTHYQKSDKEDQDRNSCTEPPTPLSNTYDSLLRKVQVRFPVAMSFHSSQPRSWPELREGTIRMAPWLGIGPNATFEACKRLGTDRVAILIAAILNSADKIRVPSAYFHALTVGKRSKNFNSMNLLTRKSSIAG